MTPPRATQLGLGLALAVTVGAPAIAHNGFGIAPIFSEPYGLIVTDGESPLVLRWTSSELHEDLVYRYLAQPTDFPPTPSPPSALRSGTLLTTIAADALSYELLLDLRTLAAGAWRLFAEFDEPPFCVELKQVPALIVIRKPDAPAPFGVMMTSPLVDSPIVDTSTDLELQAISPSPVTFTLEAGELIRDPDFPDLALCVEFTWTPLFTVAESLAMVPDPDAGPDRWRWSMSWDTSAVPDGAYLFRVTATNASGHTQTHWARRWINVEHPVIPGPTEPGPEPAPESSPDSPNPEPDGDPVASGDGCQSTPTPLIFASLLALLYRQASRFSRHHARSSARTR